MRMGLFYRDGHPGDQFCRAAAVVQRRAADDPFRRVADPFATWTALARAWSASISAFARAASRVCRTAWLRATLASRRASFARYARCVLTSWPSLVSDADSRASARAS